MRHKNIHFDAGLEWGAGRSQGCIKLLRFMRRSWVLIAYSQSNPEG